MVRLAQKTLQRNSSQAKLKCAENKYAPRRQFFAIAVLLSSIFHGETFASQSQQEETFEQVSEVNRLHYLVHVSGNIPLTILKEFKTQSVLIQDEKTRTLSGIEMANILAKEDIEKFKQVCEKAGYFDATIGTHIAQKDGIISITFETDLHQRYAIEKKIVKTSTAKDIVIDHRNKRCEFVDFNAVMRERNKIKNALQNSGYFFAEIEEPLVEIDRNQKRATITYKYTAGSLVVVSDIQIYGQGDVPKSFVAKHISLEKDTLLRQANVNDSKVDLINSGLFAEVIISAEKVSKKSPIVPHSTSKTRAAAPLPAKYDSALVKIELVPSPPHTIGGGVYFAATEGVVVSAMWQNKNFLKKALDVGAIFHGGTKELSATAFLNKPDALCRHQVFHADASLKHLNTIAYEGEKCSFTAGFIRQTKHTKSRVTYSILPTVEYGKLKQSDTSINQALFGATMNATINRANHSTNFTSGVVLDLTCHPYFGSLRSDATSTERPANAMCVFSSSAKGYIPLGQAIDTESGNATVIAALLSWGKIAIKDFACIPFDKRFYGGGRNSVRAYGYQLSGELNSEDKPIGGSSLLECCIEPRIRISKDFGAVAFFEASCVSKGEFSRDRVLCGTGLGIRYFTRFGPIRFDIALPFKRRASQKHDGKYVDRSVQFYISVGQSF